MELGLLEESLQIFRDNLFSLSGRKSAPQLIANLLEKEASTSEESAELLRGYEGKSLMAAKDIYHSMQIVLEFMDKGMKGLLSGDLSTFAIKQI